MTRGHLPLLALLILVASPVAAQTAYKSTMPDGRVIYGDAPMPGARKVEEISVAAPRVGDGGTGRARDGEEGSPGGSRGGEQARQRQQEEAMRARIAERDQLQQRVRNAEEALRLAEEAKRNGEEPLPGERLGTAGGGSRLKDEYFQRQKQLEDDVEKARQNLNEARNAGR